MLRAGAQKLSKILTRSQRCSKTSMESTLSRRLVPRLYTSSNALLSTAREGEVIPLEEPLPKPWSMPKEGFPSKAEYSKRWEEGPSPGTLVYPWEQPSSTWLSRSLRWGQSSSLALAFPKDISLDKVILALGLLIKNTPVEEILVKTKEELEGTLMVLESLELLRRGVEIISCPTCGRCRQDLTAIIDALEEATQNLKVPMTVAVMGCEVNGPGEASHADCGLAASKHGAVLFRKGRVSRRICSEELSTALIEEVYSLADAMVDEADAEVDE